jgi:hypothetical protein
MATVQTAEDTLTLALEELKQALVEEVPGREREWAGTIGRAIGHLTEALVRRQMTAATPDGLFAQVDVTRSTLARQVGALRQQLGQLLEQARALGNRLNSAAEAFLPAADASSVNPLPPPTPNRAIPDFGALRRSAQELLDALSCYQEEETKLILESINTEIGVGD